MKLHSMRTVRSEGQGLRSFLRASTFALLLALVVAMPVWAAAPAAPNLTATTNEDTPVTINVSNPNTSLYNLLLIAPTAAHGNAVVQTNTTIIYTPGANQNTAVTFGYHFCEISTATCGVPGQITVNITPVNDDPIAVDDTATTNEDSAAVVSVLANDSPGANESDALTVVGIVASPSNGAASFTSSQVIYTPNLNFCGTDTLQYRVQDSGGLSDVGQVTITVTCGNDAPTALNDTVTVNEDSTNNLISVLTNDNAGPANENQTLTIINAGPASSGTATINGLQISYTPVANFCGSVSISYTVQDDGGLTSTAVVTVNVTCLPETSTLTVTGPHSINGHTFAVDVVLNSPDTAISALDFTLGYDPNCVEDTDSPANGFAGAADNDISTSIGSGFNFAPQDLVNQIRFLVASNTNPASVLAGPSGPTSRTIATIRFKLKSTCPLTGGLYAVDFTFPAALFFDTNSQQTGGSAIPVNDLPVNANTSPIAIALAPATVQEGIAGATAGTLSTSDADAGDTHLYTLVSGAGSTDNASFQILGTQLKLQPAVIANFATKPSYSVRVRSTDPYGGFFENAFIINVIQVNLQPNAVNDGTSPVIVVVHGTPATINVLANDSDPDGGALTIQSVTQGTKGSVINGGSNVTYSATDSNYSGFDSFSYTVTDNDFPTPLTDSATVSVIVVTNDPRGDCNSDGFVNAGDLAALGLEIFDGDGTTWYNAFQSTFAGSPRGCDANNDTVIDAGDVVTTICISFTGVVCPPVVAASAVQTATLAVSGNLAAAPGATVSVPIQLDTAGNAVVAAIFAVDINDAHLSFDATDANNDGVPDAVSLNTPNGMTVGATYNVTESRIEIIIYDMPPFAELTDGTLATVNLTVKEDVTVSETAINLTTSSLGNSQGQSVPLEVTNGSVTIETQPGGQSTFKLFLPRISQ